MKIINHILSIALLPLLLLGLGALVPSPASASPAEPVTIKAGSMVRAEFIEWGCTIGAVQDGYAYTAGHCFDTDPAKRGRIVWGTYDNSDPVGTLVYASDRAGADYAVIRLSKRVRSVETPVDALPPVGARVCKMGRMTGWTCGKVVSAKGGMLQVAGRAGDVIAGDSGSGYQYRGKVVALVRGMVPGSQFGIPVRLPGGLVEATTLVSVQNDLWGLKPTL